MTEKNKSIRNFPNLRFPGFDEEWKTIKLGDITSWSSGGTPSKENPLFWNGEIPWISASSMRGLVYSDSEIKITESGLQKGSRLAKKGSLLILVRGSMLFNKIPIGIVSRDLAFNQDVKSIIVNEQSSSEYILNWFSASEPKILNMVTGTGIGAGKLDLADLKSLEVKIPILSEQKEISHFLSLINERITSSKKIIEVLKKVKSKLAQKIFLQKVKFNGNSSFNNWEIKTLGDISKITMGQSPDSSSYNTDDNGLPLIQGNADIINRKSEPRQFTNQPTKFCDVGDILLTVRAPVGYSAKSQHKACIGRGVCAIKNNSKSNSEFIYQFLLFFENKWSSIEQGSTFSSVNSSDIKSIKINIPSLEEQTKIADFLSSIDEKIEVEKKILAQYETQKKYLLANLFV